MLSARRVQMAISRASRARLDRSDDDFGGKPKLQMMLVLVTRVDAPAGVRAPQYKDTWTPYLPLASLVRLGSRRLDGGRPIAHAVASLKTRLAKL